MEHRLMMPYLSGNVNKNCFGSFQSNCREVIWPLIPDSDLDLEFGLLNIMCDIPSNYGQLFVTFDKICSSRFMVIAETGFDL